MIILPDIRMKHAANPHTATVLDVRQSAAPDRAEIYLYDEIRGEEQNFFTGETVPSQTSANYIRDKLAEMKDVGEIHLYINSCGGSVQEGLGIYNQLKRHPARKTVHIDGFACSIASVIAMCGDVVIMPGNALMMVHKAEMWCHGNPEDLRKYAEELDVISRASTRCYLEKAGGKLSPETLEELLRRQAWLSAEQCVQYGLADCLAEQDADMAKAKALLEAGGQTQKNNPVQAASPATPTGKLAEGSGEEQPEEVRRNAILQGFQKMTKNREERLCQ